MAPKAFPFSHVTHEVPNLCGDALGGSELRAELGQVAFGHAFAFSFWVPGSSKEQGSQNNHQLGGFCNISRAKLTMSFLPPRVMQKENDIEALIKTTGRWGLTRPIGGMPANGDPPFLFCFFLGGEGSCFLWAIRKYIYIHIYIYVYACSVASKPLDWKMWKESGCTVG